jgi:hypothetical protein
MSAVQWGGAPCSKVLLLAVCREAQEEFRKQLQGFRK